MEPDHQFGQLLAHPMFEIMQQDGFYALLAGAISNTYRKVAGFTFVDDTDLCVTHPSDQVQLVTESMQQVVTHWEGLLWATGGTLVPDKCFWYLIDFKCINHKWVYQRSSQIPSSIKILDTD